MTVIDPLLLACLLVAAIPFSLAVGLGTQMLWDHLKGRHDNRR